MDQKKLQTILEIRKVPSHPDESGFKEWLDVYTRFSKIGREIIPEDTYQEIIEHIKDRVAEENFVDEEFYVLKMFLHNLDEVIVKRRSVKNKRKSSHLSRLAKRRMRKYKKRYTRALRKFHKSSKGKDFHKALGRKLRDSIQKDEAEQDYFQISDSEIIGLMKSISSAMTHFIIEYEQSYQDDEYGEYFDTDLLDFMIDVSSVCMKDLKESLNKTDYERYEIVYDVIYLAGELFMYSGIETDYDYEES